jgi:hypothetical protein
LQVADIDGSCIKQSQVFVDFVSGVKEGAMQTFEIYPNPFGQMISIKSNHAISEIMLKVITGKKILAQKRNINDTININTSAISEGIYFVSILFSNGAIQTIRLCKTSNN